jgi:hypothetical protein
MHVAEHMVNGCKTRVCPLLKGNLSLWTQIIDVRALRVQFPHESGEHIGIQRLENEGRLPGTNSTLQPSFRNLLSVLRESCDRWQSIAKSTLEIPVAVTAWSRVSRHSFSASVVT